MALAIISADQRRAETTIKGMVWGKAGVGKTTLLKTLDPTSTLTIDIEGGLLAVERDDEFGPRWAGDSIKIENWLEAQAVLQGLKSGHPDFAKYKTVFVDSLSKATTLCFAWAQTQPEAFSEKTGKPDVRGAYGLLARECVSWCNDFKHLPGRNVWMVGGLEMKEIEGVRDWAPLTMGSKLANELPYIMDFNLVMARFTAADGNTYAGLFTDPIKNPEYASVPIKTRVHGLAQIEQPHLGKLMAKAISLPPKAQVTPPPSSVPAAPGDGATPSTTQANEAQAA
jgi:hypothetical protein